MAKILFICLFLLLNGCDKKPLILTGSTMGTTYLVKIADKSTVSKKVIQQRLDEINRIFSTWDATSELSLLNKKPTHQWIKVSNELFFVLDNALKIQKQSAGYFDPAIGRLLDLWGFGTTETQQKPSHQQIQKALKLSGIKHLQFKPNLVKKLKPVSLDLSAIAKGYALDAITKLLKKRGIQNFLVEIGGEVSVFGKNANKEWKIGIKQPNSNTPILITLNNESIATSGNYQHYFIWQGERYGHILNPNTGFPAKQDLTSASVLHNSAMIADAYATAMMAMGSVAAITLAKRLNLSVLLILNKQQHFKQVKINL